MEIKIIYRSLKRLQVHCGCNDKMMKFSVILQTVVYRDSPYQVIASLT